MSSSFTADFSFGSAKTFIKELGDSALKEIKQAVTDATEKCTARAKAYAPVDTGTLRESIHNDVSTDDEGYNGLVSTKQEYAEYVEYGTGQRGETTNKNPEVDVRYRADWLGMRAQPFMYPAYRETKKEFLKDCENIMERVDK